MKQTGNLLRLDDDQLKLSRRQFLKMSGAACIGAALSAVQSGSVILPTNSQILNKIPPDALEIILTIAGDTPMFQEAIGELMGLELEFNVVAEAVRISDLKGDTVGAVIGHTFSSSQRMGADLIITVDLVSRTLQMVQFVVGWSLLDTLEISSTIFDVRKPVYEEPRDIYDDRHLPALLQVGEGDRQCCRDGGDGTTDLQDTCTERSVSVCQRHDREQCLSTERFPKFRRCAAAVHAVQQTNGAITARLEGVEAVGALVAHLPTGLQEDCIDMVRIVIQVGLAVSARAVHPELEDAVVGARRTGGAPADLDGMRHGLVDGVGSASVPAPVIRSHVGLHVIIRSRSAVVHLDHLRVAAAQLEHLEGEAAGVRWQGYDLIFPSSVGTPLHPSNVRISFRRTLEEAGLPPIRFHDLRHTAASLMLNHGIPVIVVSKILGHAKPSTTMDIYGHLIHEMQGEAARLMDELVTPILMEMMRSVENMPQKGDRE